MEEGGEDEGDVFMPERNAFERVGVGRLVGGIIDLSDRSLADANKFVNRLNMTEEEKMDILIFNYFSKYYKDLRLDEKELENIKNIANNLKNVAQKNPVGIIFGYATIENGKINKEKVLQFASIKSSDLNTADIIRYARLILGNS